MLSLIAFLVISDAWAKSYGILCEPANVDMRTYFYQVYSQRSANTKQDAVYQKVDEVLERHLDQKCEGLLSIRSMFEFVADQNALCVKTCDLEAGGGKMKSLATECRNICTQVRSDQLIYISGVEKGVRSQRAVPRSESFLPTSGPVH